jgi:membrane-bound metal-dependent hydrolase YbcI (DUF457 family)
MPNYKGHLVGGAITYCCLLFICKSALATVPVAIELLGCTLLGALFPDIDTKSVGQKLVYKLIFIAMIILILKGEWTLFSCLSLISLMPPLSKHRGLFHSPWFLLFCSLMMFFIVALFFPEHKDRSYLALLFFTMGAFSHLVLDFGIRGLFKRFIC